MADNKVGIIYKITSRLYPDRCYIGSTICFKHRKGEHLNLLRKGKHHSIILQRHYNKYGEGDLLMEEIYSFPFVNKAHLLGEERFYIRLFSYEGDIKPFFNICPEPNSTLGIKHTEEANKAKSERQAGKKRAPFTEEHKKNMSVGQKKRSFVRKYQHYKKGQPSAFKGRHHTEESKQKNREKHIGSYDAVMRGVETRRKNGKMPKRDAKGHFMKKHWD